MNYEALVPSRELCEEMATLNILQDDNTELWWKQRSKDVWEIHEIGSSPHPWSGKWVKAPTLPRMLEELPKISEYSSNRHTAIFHQGEWTVFYGKEGKGRYFVDKHLPNAVSRALIAFKEAK